MRVFKTAGIVTIIFVFHLLFFIGPSAGQEKYTLRVGVTPLLNQLPYIVSYQNDRLNLESVRLELSIYNSYTSIEAALRVGALDVAGLPAPLVIKMASDGIPFKIIGSFHSGGSRLVSTTPGELPSVKGHFIGVPGLDTCENINLIKLLKTVELEYGLDYKSIRVPFATALADLRNLKINAMFFPEPFGSFAENEKLATLVQGQEKMEDQCESLLVVRSELLEKAGPAFREWLESLVNACAFIEKDLTETGGRQTAIFQNTFFGYPEDLVARILSTRLGGLRFDHFIPDPDKLNEIMNIMIRMRFLDTSVNLENFFDFSPMKKVIEEGAGK